MVSASDKHPWEVIYARDGRVFNELLPAFHEAAQKFNEHLCSRILDLGCGNGRHVIGFSKLGFEVVGFDISPSGLDLTDSWLQEENLPSALIRGDYRHGLPFKDNSFQAIFSTQVIHHAVLDEIRYAIKEIWRVLQEDGLAFITVAGKTHSTSSYEEIEPGTYIPLDGDEKGLPHHIFSKDEIRIEFSNFQILEITSRAEGRVTAIWIKK